MNPAYTSTYMFPNDFPAVQRHQPPMNPSLNDSTATHPNPLAEMEARLLKAESTRGECLVLCFSPRHDLTVAQMSVKQLVGVVQLWSDVYRSFLDRPAVSYVQIFENKGQLMGCSNPHPHGQVWATEQVPEEPRKEIQGFRHYHHETGGRCLLCDYARLEEQKQARIVCQNEHFVAVVPWWAVWPFEVLVLSKQHLTHVLQMDSDVQTALADILRRVACRYDHLFQCSFPYSMGLHQAPTRCEQEKDEIEVC